MEETKEKRSIVKSIFRFIYNTIITLITLLVIFEAVIGLINMQKINNEEEPVWYLNKKEIKTEEKKEIKYNLGLYNIVKTEEKGKMNIVLKPFFLK
ncbi:MAG: hypothetical protein IKF47_03625 [Bacilli bacterium]|nr:hypothetical protein [Bacilli bacterium]